MCVHVDIYTNAEQRRKISRLLSPGLVANLGKGTRTRTSAPPLSRGGEAVRVLRRVRARCASGWRAERRGVEVRGTPARRHRFEPAKINVGSLEQKATPGALIRYKQSVPLRWIPREKYCCAALFLGEAPQRHGPIAACDRLHYSQGTARRGRVFVCVRVKAGSRPPPLPCTPTPLFTPSISKLL